MEEMKHTPGPWVIRMEGLEKKEINVRSSVQVPDEFDFGTYEPLIADLYRGGTGNIHDARLIATAPEMLEALRMWLDIHDTPSGFAGKYGKALDAAIAAQQLRVDAAASAARAAIAKATGQSK